MDKGSSKKITKLKHPEFLGQGKVMAMSKPVQEKVRASSWQGQGEDKAR